MPTVTEHCEIVIRVDTNAATQIIAAIAASAGALIGRG